MLEFLSLCSSAYIQTMTTDNYAGLFAPIEPFHHGQLPEEDGHSVYFEECGNPQGVPVLFLHGGPGSGCTPRHRQFFDPRTCRVVLFDQRGCGRSSAKNLLYKNDTPHLIKDIERLRKHLNIGQWLVVGGSWGAGLALAYANQHSETLNGAVLRNTFLSRQSDLNWFFHDAKQLMPQAWNELVKHIPEDARNDVCQFLCRQILEGDKPTALAFAIAWNGWENALLQRNSSHLTPSHMSASEVDKLLNKFKIQSHYLQNLCFFPAAGILPQLSQLKGINIDLLHGTLDWVCRPETSWEIHRQLPQSRLQWVNHAGHGIYETPMIHCMTTTISQRISELLTT
jgi:proline iminopeptidase